MTTLKRLLIVPILLLLLAGQSWATTYVIDNDAAMLTAISTLGASDTIVIDNSWTSTTGYIITPNGVTIYGSSPSNTITLGVDNAYVFRLNGNTITIRDFTIDGNKASRTLGTGIGLAGYNETVSGMTINNAFDYGVLAFGSTTTHSINNNTITNTGGAGIVKTTYGNAIRLNTGSKANIDNNVMSNDSSGSDVVFLNGTHSGFSITNNTITGGISGIYEYCNTACDNIIVTGNSINNVAIAGAGDGIRLDAANSTVSNNTLTQSSDAPNAAWCFETAGGVSSSDNTIVSNNSCLGDYWDRSIGGGGSKVTWNRNKFRSISGNIQQNNSGSAFNYNLFVTTGAATDTLQLDSNAAGARTATLYNNVFYDAGTANNGLHFMETSGTWTGTAKNNIFYGFDNAVVVDDKDNNGIAFTHTNNDFYGNTKNIQKNVLGTFSDVSLDGTEITSDPLFVSTSDFHLTGSSPARNAGVDVGLTSDLDGKQILGLPDIGAYEFYLTEYIEYQNNMALFFGKTSTETLWDAQNRWFTALGFTNGGINQRWTDYLYSLGYTQPFPECQRLFFEEFTGVTGYQAAEREFYKKAVEEGYP